MGQGKVLKFVQNGNLTILDPVKNKALAVAVQNRMLETAQYGWLGIWYGPGASRSNVVGWLKAPVVVHWNIEKK